MAAIITEEFRKQNVKRFMDDIANDDISHYIGIGQPTQFANHTNNPSYTPYPAGTFGDRRRAIDHLTSLFRVTTSNTRLVIPHVPLLAGVSYKVYNPFDPTCFYPSNDDLVKPCYAMFSPNKLFLCIAQTLEAAAPGSSMTAANIQAKFGDGTDAESALLDYGIIEDVDGYTWAYLGEYNQFDAINTNYFTAIPDGQATGDLTESNSKASGFYGVPGFDNDIIYTAVNGGESGNDITIQYVASSTLGVVGDISADFTIPNITITYHDGTTADQIIQEVNNNITAGGLISAQPSGNGTGTMPLDADPNMASIQLSGGGTTPEFIKAQTGGMLFGFTVLDGGLGYLANNNISPIISPIIGEDISNFRVYADENVTIRGEDEFGNIKSVDVKIDIIVKRELETIISGISYWHGPIVDIRLTNEEDNPYQLGFVKAEIVSLPTSIRFNTSTWVERDAIIIPHLAPPAGFGADKKETLPAWYAGLYVDTGKPNIYIPNGSEFRQLTLVRDPRDDEGNKLEGDQIDTLPWFELDFQDGDHVPNPAVLPGDRIQQGSAGNFVGVLAYVRDRVTSDDVTALRPVRYYYIQDFEYGVNHLKTTTDFAAGASTESGNISFINNDGGVVNTELVPKAKSAPEYYRGGTGQILFMDNRAAITRQEGQNEELKLIIQL